MRVRVVNVPIVGFASVEVDVAEPTQKAILEAVRRMGAHELLRGLDGAGLEADKTLLDKWVFEFKQGADDTRGA